MKAFLVKYCLLILSIVLLSFSCTTRQYSGTQEQVLADNKYDSEYPNRSLSAELEFISNTVKKIDCLAFYVSYVFPPDNPLKEHHITDSIIKLYSTGNAISNEAVTGTAVTIYYDGYLLGMLTCAHVVDFPDTIITRYDDGKGPVEVVSIKIRQQNYIKDVPDGDPVEVLATDKKNDLAFLSKKLDAHTLQPVVLNYPIGKSKDLEWGSVVYVMGFPVGNLMVTRALVSNPGDAGKGRFLTDALYNRGISGSPVFSIRDGVPNFELVGIASSAAAQQIYYLKPGKESLEYINSEEKYNGDIFVDQKRDIKYGVTFNTSIEEVIAFLRDNKELLSRKGFDTDKFFK